MKAPSWVQWLVLAGAAASPLREGARLERPQDLPGVAAPRTPGAPRSAPVQLALMASFQVNVDSSGANITGDAANEPSIAVDPTNPNRMAIGWRQFDTVASNFRQAGWGFSHDGGRTWTFPGVLETGVFRSDPVLASDSSGTFYYNSLKVVGSSYLCDVYKSTDHGASWATHAPAYGGDKAWMTIDKTGSPGAGHVYSAWSVFTGSNTFTRSTDGAQTFSTPIPIPNEPIWGTLDVASNGTLFVGGRSSQTYAVFYAARSSNAPIAGAPASFDLSTQVDLGGPLVYYQGLGTPNPEGLLGQVNLAVDRSSGPTAGYVYMLCSVDPPGPDPLDVHFARSTNNGVSWSTPVKVNDDPPNANSWQWFGTLSVSPDGRIDVVWNDTRNTGQPNLCELYRSSSTDGGATWSANQPLSPVWNSHVGWPNQQKIGDYYHMVSDRVGADLAFAATFNGEQDVYYLRIGDHDCNLNAIGDALDISSGTSSDANGNGIPDECESGTGTPFCFGDGSSGACPCANNGASGRGCENSATTGGARLSAIGSASIQSDTLQFSSSGELPTALSIFLQGDVSTVGVPFGDGRRCVAGNLKRLYSHNAVAGAVSAPQPGDPPVSARSAALGDPLSAGSTRYYQTYYRDPAPGFCPSPTGNTWNVSSGLTVVWN